MRFSCYRLPRRYVVSIFTFFGLFLMYAMRLNLSVAVVSMTTDQSIRLSNGTTVIRVREFDWTSKEKGYLLSSFFYGYIVSEFPAGWLSKRFGGVTMFGIVLMCSSLSTLMLPFVAQQGIMVIIIFRAVVGIFEGGSYPSMYTIYSRWAPNEEKSLLLSLALAGPCTAMTICSPIYGILAHYLGWRSLFYISGAASLLWVMLWFKEIKNDPKDDPRISQIELEWIQTSSVTMCEKEMKCPWKKIFTSLPVWAIIIANLGECWGYFTIFTELPTFLNDVYNFDVHEAGILSGVPYAMSCIGMPLVGIFADYFRRKQKLSTTFVRKLCNSLCYFGQAICLALITMSTSPFHTMILLILWMCCGCFAMGGVFANYLDVAPPYAGVIMGISNTVGCIGAALCPMVAGYIVTNKTKAEWNIVFLLCSFVYFLTASFYLIFSSGNIQEWAIVRETEEDVIDESKRDFRSFEKL